MLECRYAKIRAEIKAFFFGTSIVLSDLKTTQFWRCGDMERPVCERCQKQAKRLYPSMTDEAMLCYQCSFEQGVAMAFHGFDHAWTEVE